jgi:hypothetical protein
LNKYKNVETVKVIPEPKIEKGSFTEISEGNEEEF